MPGRQSGAGRSKESGWLGRSLNALLVVAPGLHLVLRFAALCTVLSLMFL